MKIKEWISYLKNELPRVVSLGDASMRLKEVSYITDQTVFREGCLYIGNLSQVQYRFRFIDHSVLFLVNDANMDLKDLGCGSNCVLAFPWTVSVETLYERCRAYLEIQRDISEACSILTEQYLEEASVAGLMNRTAELIGNPVMLIDINYRMIAYSGSPECEDHQWQECIANGCCSYEFISQFNQLSEIRSGRQQEVPFFAGCLMSPMRRCISKIFVERQHAGYLLSIESNRPFGEVTTGILEFVSRLLAKELSYEALKSGKENYRSVWDILNYALAGREGSIPALREYLRESGFAKDGAYYLVEVNMENYVLKDHSLDYINQEFHALFEHCVTSYYHSNVVILAQDQAEQEEIRQRLLSRKEFLISCRLKVVCSDRFTDLDHIARFYKQTGSLLKYIDEASSTEVVLIYNDIRFQDLILGRRDQQGLPLFIHEKAEAIRIYDREHDTDFFRTIYAYIRNSKSLQSTADMLFVHKNTISYRIGRVKELFDVDLNDAEVRIGLYMAYEAYAMLDQGILS